MFFSPPSYQRKFFLRKYMYIKLFPFVLIFEVTKGCFCAIAVTLPLIVLILLSLRFKTTYMRCL